jgi:hypothetical protein
MSNSSLNQFKVWFEEINAPVTLFSVYQESYLKGRFDERLELFREVSECETLDEVFSILGVKQGEEM